MVTLAARDAMCVIAICLSKSEGWPVPTINSIRGTVFYSTAHTSLSVTCKTTTQVRVGPGSRAYIQLYITKKGNRSPENSNAK